MQNTQTEKKFQALKNNLSRLGSLAVAYSGGVDSTFLLRMAKEVLGENVIAVTAKSRSFPGRELTEAQVFCRQEGIRQFVVETDELQMEAFRHNPVNRCYLCKHALFGKILETARQQGIAHVAEGSNMDDTGDFRPGMKAVAELKVLSPLKEAGLYKEEIRMLSRQLNLPTWGKPSFACLASRFPYGEEITEEKLQMVDRAEQLLLDLGFTQFRVRIHGTLARIEVLPEEFDRLVFEETRRLVAQKLKEFGFSYITADMEGYRTGSMNETVSMHAREEALK